MHAKEYFHVTKQEIFNNLRWRHRRTQTNKNVCVVYTVYAKRWRSKTFSFDAESYTLPVSDGSNLRFRKELRPESQGSHGERYKKS